DSDGDVDLEDFGYFQACMAGPSEYPPAECDDAKLNGDSYVDQYDLQIFIGCMSGANIPADPNCVN
ncbi:MAG: hypothetical protein JSV03_04715, partial [Planctomycetota bacterium]